MPLAKLGPSRAYLFALGLLQSSAGLAAPLQSLVSQQEIQLPYEDPGQPAGLLFADGVTSRTLTQEQRDRGYCQIFKGLEEGTIPLGAELLIRSEISNLERPFTTHTVGNKVFNHFHLLTQNAQTREFLHVDIVTAERDPLTTLRSCLGSLFEIR